MPNNGSDKRGRPKTVCYVIFGWIILYGLFCLLAAGHGFSFVVVILSFCGFVASGCFIFAWTAIEEPADPPPFPGIDGPLWLLTLFCRPLAFCWFAISAIFLFPAMISCFRWPHKSFFTPPSNPPPVQFAALSALGLACLVVALGMLYRRRRLVVLGLVGFLVAVVAFVAYVGIVASSLSDLPIPPPQ